MNDCLALRVDNIFVEHLANSLLLAAIFALILPVLSTIQFVQTYSEAPWYSLCCSPCLTELIAGIEQPESFVHFSIRQYQ